MTTKRNPKVGTIETLPHKGTECRGQIMAQRDKDDNPVAWREFNFTDRKSKETKYAISLLVAVEGLGTVEVTCFGTKCYDAFAEKMFLHPTTVQWEEFKSPEIGDFVRLTGTFNRKFKKLTKSKNPALKAGFWATGFKVLSPTDIVIRKAPPKPKNLEALKAAQARLKKSRDTGQAF